MESQSLSKEWPSIVRAQLCTLSVSLGFHVTWRSPQLAFTHGGLQFALAFTIAMITVALPLALLQLAVGQLSRQDAVGIWRAVPFFEGIGYLRLLISFIGALCYLIYLSVTITYFAYGLNNSLPFTECVEEIYMDDGSEYVITLNTSYCLKQTFMAPVLEKPEYYLSVALILLGLWICLPFMCSRYMKRIYYVLGILVIIMVITIVATNNETSNLSDFVKKNEWRSFLGPNIWHDAVTQALLTAQVAGGYLIASGEAIYSTANAQRTALIFVLVNIITTWLSLLFWYSLGGSYEDVGVFAVFLQTYELGEKYVTNNVWPALILVTLCLSGFLAVLALVFPLYDRIRRIGGTKWRRISMGASILGACISLAVLAGRLPVITLLDNYAIPLLVSLSTVIETTAFVFIYGWKELCQDVLYLTGSKLHIIWVRGWCAIPVIITPFFIWWMFKIFYNDKDWTEPPWSSLTVLSTFAVAMLLIMVFAAIAIGKQVQYDLLSKLMASFKPSRHWGPRDPLTYYYWTSRRMQFGTRYREQLSKFSEGSVDEIDPRIKRYNSDSTLYTISRQITKDTTNTKIRCLSY